MTETATSNKIGAGVTTTFENVVCLRCGCLCDDLVVGVAKDRAVDVQNACGKARNWFLGGRRDGDDRPLATVRGRPANVEEAIEAAAALLASASHPLIDGLSNLTVEGQRVAVDLACRSGAVIVGPPTSQQGLSMRAAASAGMITATLGEIRNRADVVVAWNCDPATTHPRFFERYGLDPKGRFLPKGREERTLVAVASVPSETTKIADYVIEYRAGRDFEFAWTLRAILRGLDVDSSAAAESTGVSIETARELVATLKRSRYGVVLHDASSHEERNAETATRGILEFVGDLNEHAPFAYVPLAPGGNAAGAEQVLGWKSGATGCVDFASGKPAARRDVASTKQILENREIDAALILHGDPLADLDPGQWQWLGHVPTIVLAPWPTPTSESATVFVRTAEVGRSVRGTVFRSDGVPLPLRPFEWTNLPTDEEILGGILMRMDDSR